MTGSPITSEEQVQHIGVRTAVTFTLNRLPPLCAPASVVRVKGERGVTTDAAVLASGFVVFGASDSTPTLHKIRRPETIPTKVCVDSNNPSPRVLYTTSLGRDLVAALDASESLRVWHACKARIVGEIVLPPVGGARLTALASNASTLVVGYSCGSMVFIHHNRGADLFVSHIARNAHNACINALAIHGEVLVIGAADNIASVWDIQQKRCRVRLSHARPVDAVDIDKQYVVTGTVNEVRVYINEPGLRALRILRCSRGAMPPSRARLKLLAKGFLLVCGGYHEDAAVAFVDLNAGCVVTRVRTGLLASNALDVTKDARLIVSSAIEGEGVAIVSVTSPDKARRALKMYASRRFGHGIVRMTLAAGAIATTIAFAARSIAT